MDDWKRFIIPGIIALAPSSGFATRYLAVNEAQRLMFAEATAFEPAHVVFTVDQIQQIELASGVKVQTRGQQIWKAIAQEKLLGYFIVDYVIGKHLVIDYAIALDPDGRVKRVEVLEYRESYGGEVRGETWLKQFEGKNSHSPLNLNAEIINISGATLSSRHITEGIKRVLVTYDVVIR